MMFTSSDSLIHFELKSLLQLIAVTTSAFVRPMKQCNQLLTIHEIEANSSMENPRHSTLPFLLLSHFLSLCCRYLPTLGSHSSVVVVGSLVGTAYIFFQKRRSAQAAAAAAAAVVSSRYLPTYIIPVPTYLTTYLPTYLLLPSATIIIYPALSSFLPCRN